MALKIGLAEDRTGGLGPASGRNTTQTAAPYHRFDRNDPNSQKHKASDSGGDLDRSFTAPDGLTASSNGHMRAVDTPKEVQQYSGSSWRPPCYGRIICS